MAKETLWFPHDLEPTADPKMQAMLGDYGGLGYGAYWRIVEMLHTDNSHKLPFKKYIFSAIAKQMQANAKQNKNLNWFVDVTANEIEVFVTDCVNEYELFSADETHFFANRVFRNIEKRENISSERSIAGKKSAEARKMKAIAQQNPTDKSRVDENRVESMNIGNQSLNSEKTEKNGKQFYDNQAKSENLFAERFERHRREADNV